MEFGGTETIPDAKFHLICSLKSKEPIHILATKIELNFILQRPIYQTTPTIYSLWEVKDKIPFTPKNR